jgi:hypothetical protein
MPKEDYAPNTKHNPKKANHTNHPDDLVFDTEAGYEFSEFKRQKKQKTKQSQ